MINTLSKKEGLPKMRVYLDNDIKSADAHHIASAIFAKCKYLLTTDDRWLKYTSEQIKIIDPITFVKQIGGFHND